MFAFDNRSFAVTWVGNTNCLERYACETLRKAFILEIKDYALNRLSVFSHSPRRSNCAARLLASTALFEPV